MPETIRQGGAALIVEDLSKSFRNKTALDGVGFAMPEASLTVILGPAGAGKTTTLRLIAGLDRPDAGRVSIGGRDVTGWEPKDRNVAMILDSLALYPDKSGFQNIASPLLIRGTPKDEVETRVTEMAKLLKVNHILDRLPKTMSGGERQRIALGRALVRSPSLFLLDEPLSSLDAMLRIELRAELKRLQREHGYSFLLATPDYNEALTLADTVIMLRQGRVVQTAAPQDLYDRPRDLETARFVGAPQINLLDASLDPDGPGRIRAAGGFLPLPPDLSGSGAALPPDFVLGVRPENLRLIDPAREPSGPSSPTAPAAALFARLLDIEVLGRKSVATVRNESAELRVLLDSSQARAFREGDIVGLGVADPSRLLAFHPGSGLRLE
jgi:multiple sugar transport system ATP-binding protein